MHSTKGLKCLCPVIQFCVVSSFCTLRKVNLNGVAKNVGNKRHRFALADCGDCGWHGRTEAGAVTQAVPRYRNCDTGKAVGAHTAGTVSVCSLVWHLGLNRQLLLVSRCL